MGSLKKLDNFIIEFSKNIHSKDHFDRLLKQLFTRKKYAIDQSLWKELYLTSLQFYKSKKISNIPTNIVTKHNHIIPFYMQHKIHTKLDTLVHFDSHLDQNPIKNSKLLPKLYENYLINQNSEYLDKTQEIVWDIGAANSGILHSTGIRDFIWAMPTWLPDAQIEVPFTIKNGNYITTDSYINNNEFSIVDKFAKDKQIKLFQKIQTGKIYNNTFTKLKQSIEKNGKTYFLDIDLDYFVCNGKKFNKSYWKESFDLESFYRTKYLDFNQDIPRYKYEDTRELGTYSKKLEFEITQINKRIRYFLKIIRQLKRNGLVPSLISICDSTNIEFNNCENLNKNCNSISNNYCPENIVLFVHTRVFDGLNKIFN